MKLSDDTLFARIDDMPCPPEHTTVWHLCNTARHPGCVATGRLAEVHNVPPEISEDQKEGDFLMRLHPRAERLTSQGDKLRVDLRRTLSFPHSTVWRIPVEPKKFEDPDTGEIFTIC